MKEIPQGKTFLPMAMHEKLIMLAQVEDAHPGVIQIADQVEAAVSNRYIHLGFS
jgi:hypothetical protein